MERTQPFSTWTSARGSRHLGYRRLGPRALLVGIVALAAWLRFYGLDASSLWSDEGNTWAIVQRSFAMIARDAGADIHPPGYYWLLRLWTLGWGTDAYALRAFSALCGVGVVLYTYVIARQIAAVNLRGFFWLGYVLPLVAAFGVAVNPFQIYYSQEARMYMPLALAAGGLYSAILAYTANENTTSDDTTNEAAGKRVGLHGLLFWLWGSIGLWLHYSFPFLLLGAGLYYLHCWWHGPRVWTRLARFVGLSLAIVASFLPWLPIALGQIFSWPGGNVAMGLGEGVGLTLQTWLAGPRGDDLRPESLWLWAAGVLPLVGLWAMYRGNFHIREPGGSKPVVQTDPVAEPGPADNRSADNRVERVGANHPVLAVALWWLLPVLMMFGLGLFTEAFLKFLLTASVPWAIACAWAIAAARSTRLGGAILTGAILAVVVAGASLLAVQLLPAYYQDPLARDNYAGIARYVAAHSRVATADPQDPATAGRDTLVILNAPGQLDVWNYYDPGVPVLALPATRPADRAATEAALAAAVDDRTRIFGVFWATDEADPESIVESWLGRHAFAGLESWQGNVRLIDYSLPANLECSPVAPRPRFVNPVDGESGPVPVLTQLCREQMVHRPGDDRTMALAAGDVLLMGLHWTVENGDLADAGLGGPAMTLQLLDGRNQVVGQRDAPLSLERDLPAQNHGIPVPVGTPPGNYRLLLAVYDPVDGHRWRVATHAVTDEDATGGNVTEGDAQIDVPGDALWLGTVHIARPQSGGAGLVDAQFVVHREMGPVTLVGYDLHRRDYAHAPQTSVAPGDPVQFTFYWQAPAVLPPDWPDDQTLTLVLGQNRHVVPLAGGDYPTGLWQADEIVRTRLELPWDGTTRHPTLTIGNHTIRLAPIP